MEQEIRRLRRRRSELAAFVDRATLPLPGHFQAADMEKAVPLSPGQPWPSRSFPVRMGFLAAVPSEWAGQPVWVRVAAGGEGLLLVQGRAWGGLDPYHKEYELLASARGGEEFLLEVEAVPRGPFGAPIPEPRLEEASLLVPDLDVRRLLLKLDMTIAAAETLEPEIGLFLLDAVQAALAAIPLPRSPAEAYLARMLRTPLGQQKASELWEEWSFPVDPLRLPEETRAALLEAERLLDRRLGEIRRHYPPRGELEMIGHAHLDLGWLWPVEETRRKARRTFATACSLMQAHPGFVFGQSQAQLYAWLEEDDPELFERVRLFVRKGQWELLGGMWVECDGNLLSGESWARQLLYGQRYFLSRFGSYARVAWLPDSFGFAANLPQLLSEARLNAFFTTKLTWNETNVFPYDLYWWEGLDGTRILAHSIRNVPRGYNGHVEPADLWGTWQNFRGKRYHPASLFLFGEGDGGGGPTREMVTQYRFLSRFPGLPSLKMGRVEDYFRRVRSWDLPVWVGEQYLELHRGTYTTQARVKALHRRLEHLLPEAEMAATLAWLQGESYPADEIEALWKGLLRNQFHDILPGSGIHTVAQEAEAELTAVAEQAETLRLLNLTYLSQGVKGHPESVARVVVWNLSLDDRPLRIEFPQPADSPFRLLTPEGKEIPYQEERGRIIAASSDPVPGLGYVTLSVVPGTPDFRSPLRARKHSLQNSRLHARIGKDGTLQELVDRALERAVVSGQGNEIWAYVDIPRDWDAWDIDASYEREGLKVAADVPPEVVEAGPARCGIRVVRRVGNSTIEQTYRLWNGGSRLEIVSHVVWEERNTLLRALFHLPIRSHEAWFETAFGAVARPTHRNTPWDRARFEVPGLRFVDLSEPDFGVSLLSDSKYGYSAHGHTLGISLLRGPTYPDPLADCGEHRFTYALYPHAGDWRNGTVAEAHDLNAPLVPILLPGPGGQKPAVRRFLGVDRPGVRLAALKPTEDGRGILLRLYEAHGTQGFANLCLPTPEGWTVWSANLLEEPIFREGKAGNPLSLFFLPFQVQSLLVVP